MAKININKKRVVTSFNNLPVELQEMVKAHYPLGYTEAMMRIDKPNGDFVYAVPYQTDEIDYLVKVDVKIDNKVHDNEEEDDDKDMFEEDINAKDEMIEEEDDDM